MGSVAAGWVPSGGCCGDELVGLPGGFGEVPVVGVQVALGGPDRLVPDDFLEHRRLRNDKHWVRGQIVQVMLGTSARIGEVLAIRVADLDLDAPVPMVCIAGTIVSRKGEPTHRQDHPKAARSVHRVALSGFALRAVRARVRGLRFAGPETVFFATRVGTPHTTNNVRRQLRDVLEQAGIEDVTPHRFRRTAATAIKDVGGLQLASELLGHSDPAITREHYIRRNETVIPATADLLEQAFERVS